MLDKTIAALETSLAYALLQSFLYWPWRYHRLRRRRVFRDRFTDSDHEKTWR